MHAEQPTPSGAATPALKDRTHGAGSLDLGVTKVRPFALVTSARTKPMLTREEHELAEIAVDQGFGWFRRTIPPAAASQVLEGAHQMFPKGASELDRAGYVVQDTDRNEVAG